jgi:dihydroorotate dehydrogenase
VLARSAFFRLDPERAHDLALVCLDQAPVQWLLRRWSRDQIIANPRRVMGLDFPNPVGLAAGLDKDAKHLAGLSALGFGFIEVGTVTPRPQPGNPRPRLFRLASAEALINRFGFNSDGVEAMRQRLLKRAAGPLLGINIGKNRDTPTTSAADDYLQALRTVYPLADYVTVNVSSPNTPGLRDLQATAALDELLRRLKSAQSQLAQTHGKYVPLVVKIAPDLGAGEIAELADTLRRHRVEGVIATNTTSARPGVMGQPHAKEGGGLSGKPLAPLARATLVHLAAALAGDIPIISVGGIASGAEAVARLRSGASLVQLYTGLIYRGPSLVGEVSRALATT